MQSRNGAPVAEDRESGCELIAHIRFELAGATRLELATSGVTGRRSNQLNYAPVGPIGNVESACQSTIIHSIPEVIISSS